MPKDGIQMKMKIHKMMGPSYRPRPVDTTIPVEPIVISSDDEIRPPPGKRPKLKPSSNAKRKRPGGVPGAGRRPFIIDLTACDDLIDEMTVQPPRKKQKQTSLMNETKCNPIIVDDSDDEKEEDSDLSDSDYDNLHDGYDVRWSTSAVEPAQCVFNLDVDAIGQAVAKLQLYRVDPHIVQSSRKFAPLSVHEATTSNYEPSLQYLGPSSFRQALRSCSWGPVRVSYCGGRSRSGMLLHRPSQLQSPLNNLRLFSRFQMADASQSITQSSSIVLVTSSTPGGSMEDEYDGRVDPYNSRNTLALWTEETGEHWLQGHCALPPRRKYYDIKCARFDPRTSNVFVSTGLDGSLAIWKYMKPIPTKRQRLSPASSIMTEDDDVAHYIPVKQWGKETYKGCCHDIVYRPQSRPDDPTLFATPCDNGTVFVHSYTNECNAFSPILRLRISRGATHKAGATVWGRRSTSNKLFVCSEADYAYHGAFNIDTGQLLYHLDRHENGEEIALDPNGNTLALLTVEERLELHLYDVEHCSPRRTASVHLPPPNQQLPTDTLPEVRTVSWSPDGLLLAVGCNDDVAHVYDVRCLERGPVMSLIHETRSSSRGLPLLSLPEEERMESKNCFGITVLSWTSETYFNSQRIGLLTGGGDHCIALWDVKTACENRHVVAELDGHVGSAHFGDFGKGEKPLVAGDTDGHIYIYDFVDRKSS